MISLHLISIGGKLLPPCGSLLARITTKTLPRSILLLLSAEGLSSQNNPYKRLFRNLISLTKTCRAKHIRFIFKKGSQFFSPVRGGYIFDYWIKVSPCSCVRLFLFPNTSSGKWIDKLND